MDIHENARTTPYSRARIAERVAAGEPAAAVARAFGVSARTVHKWVARAAAGELALEDRSCRPHTSPRAISSGLMVEIEQLRRRWRWTGAEIAAAVGVSRATVARTLGQLGLARLGPAAPPGPSRRYQWARPGELLHLDIKKLGRIGQVGHRITGDRRQRVRGIGWEFVHVCIDDCSRVAYAEVLPDERSVTVAGFLRRALTWFARRGVRGQRMLTDNGSAYRSHRLAALCRVRRIRQRFTRPYTPRTNGKAERFTYNWHRGHSALNRQPPLSRVLPQDDLLRLHN